MYFCPKDKQTEEALTLETKRLLAKGAIEVVHDRSYQAFTATSF